MLFRSLKKVLKIKMNLDVFLLMVLNVKKARLESLLAVSYTHLAMAMNAVDAGNYDLFKEYVSSPEFDRYFQEAGLELNGSR